MADWPNHKQLYFPLRGHAEHPWAKAKNLRRAHMAVLQLCDGCTRVNVMACLVHMHAMVLP